MNAPFRFFLTQLAALIVFTIAFSSCETNQEELLARTWQMQDEIFSVEFRKNHKYVFRSADQSVEGKWKINKDDSTLTLKEGKDRRKVLVIRELSEEKLILSDNGDLMVFSAADTSAVHQGTATD